MRRIETEVLVVGGGTAGTLAAIAAAEEGCRVVVVERDGGIGGTGIHAGIHLYYYGRRGGLQDRLDREAARWSKDSGSKAIGYHPGAKEMMVEARVAALGIQVLYEAVVAEIVMEGRRVTGAIVESERETVEVSAKVTIDATGDGDVACMAGASYTLGRKWDGAQHAYSLVTRYADGNGVLRFRNDDIGWLDVTDERDVSRAYRVGRQYAWRGDTRPDNTHYIAVGPQLGIREGRRIVGDYVLHQDDLLLDRRQGDVVLRCYAHLENHAYDYANESEWSQIWIGMMGRWKLMFGGDVPYRCLLPEGIDGMLLGCRAVSQDHDCGMLFRMQRDMQKVGEVAGVAAAMSIRADRDPRRLDIRLLQERLIARGVLDSEDLTRPSSPWLVFEGETGEDRLAPLMNGVTAEDVAFCIERLGGEEEDTALWWLWQYGDVGIPALLQALPAEDGRRQRGIALALGLLRHPAAAAYLADMFRRRDGDRPNELDRTEERWVAALMLLRRMKDSAIADDVLERMPAERQSTLLLLYLHYLIAVASQLSSRQRHTAVVAVRGLLSDPNLGTDYRHHGSGDSIPSLPDTRSIRWSIELTAACLLELAGGTGLPIMEAYKRDERGYVRVAAQTIAERTTAMMNGEGSGCDGKEV